MKVDGEVLAAWEITARVFRRVSMVREYLTASREVRRA
jgi:hypothetical protein